MVGRLSPSALNTKGRVRPPRSRITTAQQPLPDWLAFKLLPIFLAVRRLHVAADKGAVDLDITLEGAVLGAHRLAQLVGQDESRLVPAI